MRKPEKNRSSVVPPEPVVPSRGSQVWTCRAQFEAYLFEELERNGDRPRMLCEGAVESSRVTNLAPVFGRSAFKVVETFGPGGTIEAWNLDTTAGNKASSAVRQQAEAEQQKMQAAASPRWVLCAFGGSLVVRGGSPTGGLKRMRREADDLSRAALKVEEALEWLGDGPGRGETCVDLGAAPGGWTQRLLARGTRVIAVDPAKMQVVSNKLRHVQDSAFRFQPEEPVEWLFCDMAWRPLEVAQLLAKWGRNKWAIRTVSNIKLPMKEKWQMLDRVRETMEEAGWRDLKMRQLYHDRDEITLTARAY